MHRKAFRDLDVDLEPYRALQCQPGRERHCKKAYRGIDLDDDDEVCWIAAPTLLCILADISIFGSMTTLLSGSKALNLPTDLIAESVYLVATTVISLVIDARALIGMFLTSQIRALNWAASVGTICSVLKLSLVTHMEYDISRVSNSSLAYDLVSAELQLTSVSGASSSWRFERFYGSICCTYLATVFAITLLQNGQFYMDQVATKMRLYILSGLTLSMFARVFEPQSSMGWLVVVHALIVAWAVAQCKRYRQGNEALF